MCNKELYDYIKNSQSIVFFGGAGVSTESNIPDFRSSSGLYEIKSKYKYEPEVMLSHSFFEKHTEEFFKFYRDKMIYAEAKPNAAHKALAKLEAIGKLKSVITQNIDGLHQEAGSKEVIELHGSVHRNYCVGCGKSYSLDYIIKSKSTVPICEICKSVVRPDVVLYEESLKEETIEKAIYDIARAEILIVGGTSLVVYPAAGLIRYYRGKKLILINKSSTAYDGLASLAINDSIGNVLDNVVKCL